MEEQRDHPRCPKLRKDVDPVGISRHCSNDYCDALTLDNDCRALRIFVQRLPYFAASRAKVPSLTPYKLRRSEQGITDVPFYSTTVLFLPDSHGNPPGRYMVTSRMHLHKIVATQQPPYRCPLCDETCYNKAYLYHHVCQNHMRYRCNVCAMGFGLRGSYTSHAKEHKSTKHFECCVCGKRCFSSKSFSKHLKFHSERLDSVAKPCKRNISRPREGSSAAPNEGSSTEYEIRIEPEYLDTVGGDTGGTVESDNSDMRFVEKEEWRYLKLQLKDICDIDA